MCTLGAVSAVYRFDLSIIHVLAPLCIVSCIMLVLELKYVMSFKQVFAPNNAVSATHVFCVKYFVRAERRMMSSYAFFNGKRGSILSRLHVCSVLHRI